MTVTVLITGAKVAVTDVLPFMVRVQVPVPAQPPPLQPLKVEPWRNGVAVKVTVVPEVKFLTQSVPGAALLQLTPPEELRTSPPPTPARRMERE